MAEAVGQLLARQSAEGSWRGDFDTGAYVNAIDVIFRRFVGDPALYDDAGDARWILSLQNADGGWSSCVDAQSDLTSTVASYAALRLCGVDGDDASLVRARRFTRSHGGLEAPAPWLMLHLAMVGIEPWDSIPALPVRPFLSDVGQRAVAQLAWWSRDLGLAVAVLTAVRPVRPVAVSLDELRCAEGWGSASWQRRTRSALRLARLVQTASRRSSPIDVGLQDAAKRKLLSTQDRDGMFGGGILFATQFCVQALLALGYERRSTPIVCALAAMDRHRHRDSNGARIDFCDSRVCDTAIGLRALTDSRTRLTASETDTARRAVDYLLGRQLACGGWAFEPGNEPTPTSTTPCSQHVH